MGTINLETGSRVAVIGGGPAGSLFSHFLLTMARRAGKDIAVDIYEPKDFDTPDPTDYSNCGGIISEWLVQALAADGINLPTDVVERGIDSYVLHMDAGDVRIDTPLHEKRIGVVRCGAGPRGIKEDCFRGLDSFLLEQARNDGARIVHGPVDAVELRDGRPHLKTCGGEFQRYDLMAVAVGKNNAALKMLESLNIRYKPLNATKTYTSQIYLGRDAVAQYLGSSMHVFLVNLPRLKFAALVPKGDYATMCLRGDEIDRDLLNAFVNSAEFKQCLPSERVLPADLCECSPPIRVEGAVNPFADRVVFVGDCGVTPLYEDGIGAAYRTAKAAVVTAIFQGIGAEDFRKHYAPLLHGITKDNQFGRILFWVMRLLQQLKVLRVGVLRMVAVEQQQAGAARRMSTVLWDTFTGSAPYREVFLRTLHPAFWAQFLWETVVGVFSFTSRRVQVHAPVGQEALGKVYRDGEVIIRQGDVGDRMFVIQSGQVEIVRTDGATEVRLALQGAGDFFGEMALVEHETRSATVRAVGEARVLTIDQRTFDRRIREDPSLAYRILQKMSERLRELNETVAVLVVGAPSSVPSVPVESGGSGDETLRVVGVPDGFSRRYRAGDVIIRQGQADDCMYIIQAGQVEVVQERNGKEIRLALAGTGDLVGEMAILGQATRSATVRALTDTRVLALDRDEFLRRVHEDPSLAYRIMQNLAKRIRALNVAHATQVELRSVGRSG